jgi:hypothetical protein
VIEKRNGPKGPYLYASDYENGNNNFFKPISQKTTKVSELEPIIFAVIPTLKHWKPQLREEYS